MCSESLPVPSQIVDQLDRRIVGALQVDGRASWQRIARAIGEHERTVTRRGIRLLESGMVKVVGVRVPGNGTVIALKCAAGQARMCSTSVSGRNDSMWSHAVTGSFDVIAEVNFPRAREAHFLLDELPAVPGMKSSRTYPVLRYIRTAHRWQPGLLTADERAELERETPLCQQPYIGDLEDASEPDRQLISALSQDGRKTYEELGRIAGVSETTVRRRLEQLRLTGKVLIRAIVDPAALGLTMKAIIWVSAQPSRLEDLISEVGQDPRIRYASMVAGPRQVLMQVDFASRVELDHFITRASWIDNATSIDVSLVIGTSKRSGMATGHPA